MLLPVPEKPYHRSNENEQSSAGVPASHGALGFERRGFLAARADKHWQAAEHFAQSSVDQLITVCFKEER